MPNKSNRNNSASDRNGRNGNGKNGRTGQASPNRAQRRTRAVPKNDRRDDERLRYINQIGGISGGGARVISGRAANVGADRYSERVRRESERGRGQVDRKRETFPNRRRKIITGKDLTTPLKGRVKAKREKVKIGVKVVNIKKERLPWAMMLGVLVLTSAICMLIYSYIVLYDVDSSINRTRSNINSERLTTQILERQYQAENDPTDILVFAREELGMVEERFIQTHYVRSHRENRAVVVQEENNRLSNILSVVFRRD